MNWLKQNWTKVDQFKKFLFFNDTNQPIRLTGFILLGFAVFSYFVEIIPPILVGAILLGFSIPITTRLHKWLSKQSEEFLNRRNFFIFFGLFILSIILIAFALSIKTTNLTAIIGVSALVSLLPLAYITIYIANGPNQNPLKSLKILCVLSFVIISPFFVAWVISNSVEYVTNDYRNDGSFGFICPSSFETHDKYIGSVAQWVSRYTEKYPDAKVEELMAVRDRLIEKNKCGIPPFAINASASSTVDAKMDTEKLMAGIKYAESQRVDKVADELIKTTNEKELYGNPYIKHLRTAFNGYLAGTNDGVEEGATDKSELEGGYRCGLDSFDKNYYKSEFTVVKVVKGDYGGVVAYITFLNKPDTLFWALVYQYGGGEYTLRGFCENAALIKQ